MTGIYKIESPSGGIYIGKSRNVTARWQEHKKPGEICNNILKRSFNKHGVKSHSFTVIHELPEDIADEVLNTYEILYIYQFRSSGSKMLNITDGGTGGSTRLGMKNSNKQKIAASEIGKKRKLSPERSKQMLAARLKKYPIKVRNKITLPRDEFGKVIYTQEFKDKISNTHKNNLTDDKRMDLINKCIAMAANNKGKRNSKETIAKRIESVKKFYLKNEIA